MFYKVLTSNLESCTMQKSFEDKNVPIDFVVQYKVGEWVFPKVPSSKLMVFNKLSNAKYFLDNYRHNGGVIYECEIGRIFQQAMFFRHVYSLDFIHTYDKYLKLKKQHRNVSNLFAEPPTGTVFTNKVKLIDKV